MFLYMLVLLLTVSVHTSVAQPASLCLKMVEMGMYDRALAEGNRLLRAGYREYYTYACLTEANVGVKNYGLALRYALRMQERAKANPERLVALVKAGEIHTLMGSYGKAVEAYEDAIRLAKTLRSTSMEVGILKRLAEVHVRAGDYKRAVEVYYRISSTLEEGREKLKLLEKLADVLTMSRRYEEAINTLTLVTQLAEDLKDMGALAKGYINRGGVYRLKGDPSSAYLDFKTGVNIAISIGNRYMQAIAYEQMGELDMENLNLEEARKNLQTARELFLLERKRAEANRVGEKLELVEMLRKLKPGV